MKIVTHTMYQAHDGREFTTADACTAYEAERLKVDEILAQLGPVPKDDCCQFANGTGYIQHDPSRLEQVFLRTLEVMNNALVPKLEKARVDSEARRKEKELRGEEIDRYHYYDRDMLVKVIGFLADRMSHYPPSRDDIHSLHYYEGRVGIIGGVIVEVLHRFYRIDFGNSREFGQPYYASHQNEVRGGVIERAVNEGAVP